MMLRFPVVFLFVALGFLSSANSAEVRPAPASGWDKIVAGANQEGKVTIYGAPEIGMQNAFLEFQKAYPQVRVGFVSGSGSAIVPRALTERRADKYLMDVGLFGHGSMMNLHQGKALDPIGSALQLPEVADPAKWWRGRHWYGDEEGRYVFIFSGYLTSPLSFNSKQLDPAQLRSYWDLVDPKWRGRILTFDPRQRGPITDVMTFFYYHPALGPSFLKRLYGGEMGLGVTADHRQGIDWLATGKFALAIGLREVDEAKRKGLPVDELNTEGLKEGAYITPGFGTIGLGNRSPHPNAARLLINWFLSADGQAAWQKHTGNASLRRDVSRSGLPPNTIPKEDGNYIFMALPQHKMDDRVSRKFVASLFEPPAAR
jgi:iron(III) transport system substrate-binding protein